MQPKARRAASCGILAGTVQPTHIDMAYPAMAQPVNPMVDIQFFACQECSWMQCKGRVFSCAALVPFLLADESPHERDSSWVVEIAVNVRIHLHYIIVVRPSRRYPTTAVPHQGSQFSSRVACTPPGSARPHPCNGRRGSIHVHRLFWFHYQLDAYDHDSQVRRHVLLAC